MGVITYGASLQNEVKAWPPLVQIGSGFDLVTQNQWWDDEGTPTTKATAVPSSGEASLDAKFLEVIKCVTDAADEGFLQRYTYAEEPRIKSGSHLSALVWVATTSGGSGITAKLRNSGGSSTTGTVVATDGDWSLIAIEDHTCSGTYVELVVTKDAAGTFYAGGNITVMVGADAVELPPRGLRLRWCDVSQIHDYGAATVTVAFADEDVTSVTSPLAAIAECSALLHGNTGIWYLQVRRNGSSDSSNGTNVVEVGASSSTGYSAAQFSVILDDQQVFEHGLVEASAGTLGDGDVFLHGYWEWE